MEVVSHKHLLSFPPFYIMDMRLETIEVFGKDFIPFSYRRVFDMSHETYWSVKVTYVLSNFEMSVKKEVDRFFKWKPFKTFFHKACH